MVKIQVLIHRTSKNELLLDSARAVMILDLASVNLLSAGRSQCGAGDLNQMLKCRQPECFHQIIAIAAILGVPR
jgi:hypothetical protein